MYNIITKTKQNTISIKIKINIFSESYKTGRQHAARFKFHTDEI